MEINSFISTHFQSHFKKLLIFCTATATIYLIKRYLDKKRKLKPKKEKKKIKEFPTIEEIQKFIEDLPFDAVNSGKSVTLKDLLGELSEFSEDEDWKELIASVHNLYQDNGLANKEKVEETGSIMSIYEDPNVITLNEVTPRDEDISEAVAEANVEINQNKAKGDVEIANEPSISEKKDENEFEALIKNSGEGDTKEFLYL